MVVTSIVRSSGLGVKELAHFCIVVSGEYAELPMGRRAYLQYLFMMTIQRADGGKFVKNP
eukprot:4026065-Ditylum_brightwellii.AAC.1